MASETLPGKKNYHTVPVNTCFSEYRMRLQEGLALLIPVGRQNYLKVRTITSGTDSVGMWTKGNGRCKIVTEVCIEQQGKMLNR